MCGVPSLPGVRPVIAAICLRCRKAPVSCGVGFARRLFQECRPLGTRQALIVPVGARMFAAMVEEADIVVGLFQRLDLRFDEGIEFVQMGLQVGWNREIHVSLPLTKPLPSGEK